MSSTLPERPRLAVGQNSLRTQQQNVHFSKKHLTQTLKLLFPVFPLLFSNMLYAQSSVHQTGQTNNTSNNNNNADSASNSNIKTNTDEVSIKKSQSAKANRLADVSVTATREGVLLRETPAAVSIISRQKIEEVAPTHPQELLRQSPGVALTSTNGEGHTTAIRQPFNTSPVYLFLEDSIPIRATGFFNHNALYEINLPQAGSVEIIRGPGSALYGSDAIGGIVNILTRLPTSKNKTEVSGEIGTYGYQRTMLSTNTGSTDFGAIRADILLSHTDGWRQRSAYDRQNINLRWDQSLKNDALLKTIVNYTHIDQETGAGSNLSENDYRNDPTRNYFGIAYRKVEALRISSAYEQSNNNDLISLTPYFRDNRMDLFASFNMSNDPTYNRSYNQSYGLLSKWRRDFPNQWGARLIMGLDLEYSPGSREEDSVTVTRSNPSNTAERIYTNPRNPKRIFDYNVTFKSSSPYIHGEISPTATLRLSAGLRYDDLQYSLRNKIGNSQISDPNNIGTGTGYYYLNETADRTFKRLSPKLGFTWALSQQQILYGSYTEGFRAPSENQLFRAPRATSSTQAQARAAASLALEPIKAKQFEMGLRGESSSWYYDWAWYLLSKKDDITSVRDPLNSNNRININAGETSHLGTELALGKQINQHWNLDTALSYSIQRYENNQSANGNFSGKAIPMAPRVLANTILSYKPNASLNTQLEWTRVGAYWLDDNNTTRYNGHSLFNLRMRYQASKSLYLFARLNNLNNRRYAESANLFSVNGQPTQTQITYSPGLPRTVYAGLEYRF